MIDKPEKYYTPVQIGELLQVKPVTVLRWLKTRKLEVFRIGRIWRISHSQLQEFLQFNYDNLDSAGKR